MGITDFVPFDSQQPQENECQQPKQPVGTRREWRIKKQTGELRGVSIRERNKDRKPVGWLDKDSPGWDGILASYERWQRAARYAVGTLEQRPTIHDKQPTSQNHGNVSD